MTRLPFIVKRTKNPEAKMGSGRKNVYGKPLCISSVVVIKLENDPTCAAA